ncbi:MAG: hypothetical protein GX166_02165 [Clostridiaceae bacterium]|nr:hypothetical protein [Clostridiaceae bacterium]
MKRIKVNVVCMGICLIFGLSMFFTDLMLDGRINKLLYIYRIIIASCVCYFLPEVYRHLKKVYLKTKLSKELYFLKKLFVICGSVKPVDFGKLMKSLIARSEHFKKDLVAIYEAHQKSSTDTEMFYQELKAGAKDLEVKLFYEKLDMACYYDFDLSVKTIKDDFAREKRESIRKVKKKVELINVVGVLGLFVALTVLVVYLLAPWIKMLEFSGLGW